MQTKKLPLQELSIAQIYNGDTATYEVPIYQRNYAWEKDEIYALVQDVYDAKIAKKQTYFIGTLVTYHKGDQIYEVIDGQQRLTTINIVLGALKISVKNKLTYRARKKSDATIKSIPNFNIDDKDDGIVNGFNYAKSALLEIVSNEEINEFKEYFQNQVHLIHYQVPKDIDLNHYFEVMNSRGEQLEKHEIIKARLIEKLEDVDKEKLSRIWEFCSDMSVYIQQKYRDTNIFGPHHYDFIIEDFDALPNVEKEIGKLEILNLLSSSPAEKENNNHVKLDTFQPIMDFSNFLLVVLKVTRMSESDFVPSDFILDDKELIREFDKVPNFDTSFAKQFGFNLLKAKYLLDNYLVHHSEENDTLESNPWKLQNWYKEGSNEYLKNLDEAGNYQNKLVQLLSMFEVTFTARQRKNYLFYCLYYLFNNEIRNIEKYAQFVDDLANKYFKDIYLVPENLNAINTPNPGSFDKMILSYNHLNLTVENNHLDFTDIYGDGCSRTKGIPLFVFNYLDYKLWEQYANNLRGKTTVKGDRERLVFFEHLGCSDFGLDVFNNFYFSRTRRSLEHYFPTANANGIGGNPNQDQINCFGNFAMIGSEANSSGSNWSPKTKLDHYLDESGKIKLVSVASLKFIIMMRKCRDNHYAFQKSELEWGFDDIKEHQTKMIEILLN